MTINDLPAAWLPLADAVLKATVVFAAAALASVLLKQASAAVRHMVWTLAITSALLVPALSLALPRWQLPVVQVAAPPPAAALEVDGTGPAREAPRVGQARPSRLDGAAPAAGERTTEPTEVQASRAGVSFAWPSVLLAIWGAGVLLIVGRMVAGLVVVRLMSHGSERILDAPWLKMACSLASEVGVSSQITFIRSSRATMPMAWGIFRPSVLMPSDADQWPVERLRIVLLHELAHVKRRDCLTHLMAQMACAIYWFNPLVWLAVRHIRIERERACDDLVIAAGTRGTDYADQLVAIARAMRAGRFPAVLAGATLAMAHRSQLEGRLMAILDPRVPRAGLSRVRTALATVACFAAVMPLAAVQPWSYSDQNTTGANDPTQAAQPAQAVAAAPAAAQPAPEPQTRQAADAGQIAADGARPVAGMALEALADSLKTAVKEGAFDGAIGGAAAGAAGAMANPNPNPNWNTNKNYNSNKNVNAGSDDDEQEKADPRLVAALIAALKDSDREVRENALHALARLRDPAVFEPLVQALKDAAADIREQAAHGLGQLRDRRAVGPLIGALKDENPGVREQAVFALGQLRDREAGTIAALSAALKDVNPSVREQVVFALGQLRDPSTIAGLTAALRDDNPDVREQAAFALGQIRDKRSVEVLVPALKDADADVREQAAFALGQIRDRGAVEALVFALKDGDADVREQAAFALGQLRDPRAIDGLTAALKDSSASVRQQAAFALGQLAR
jgi:HEAT repeat protein/beta-lactamase regulating signal transducer with metallopeptidase domain